MRNLLKESDTKVNGNPISFIDIDETTMHTFAKVNVMKDGKVVKSLDNQEFNTHELGDGETYNFDNFRDAKYFNQTSKPIEKTINRIKNIIQSIKDNKKQEKVIFLTARADFDNKEVFLDTFRNFGIDVDIPNVHIERSGNLTDIKNVADRKKYVILKYLKTGLYTNAKMYDDDKKNLETFEELGQEVNSGKYNILNNVKKNFPRVNKINFYPLLVTNNGKIKMYESKESNEEILIEAIDAYHGSHKNFDKFDTKFIGTGEKCQAHGWGLYFSLTPETAKNYHKKISGWHVGEKTNGTDMSISYDGKTYPDNTIQGIIIKKMYKKGKDNTLQFLKNLSKESQFSKDPEKFKDNVRKLYNMVKSLDENKFKETIKVSKGQFYSVKIPDLDTYIDEDKNMGNQSPEVISICKDIMKKLNNPFKAKNMSGRSFYNKLKYYSLNSGDHFDRGENNFKEVSKFLHDNGITGIKYNGGTDGKCVVIFDKDDVKIVKKDVDYGTSEVGFEMSEITKFIDDPKKLKGKRVKPEIINWFIENRPELIDNKVYFEKLDDEQRVKYIVYVNNVEYGRKPIEELEKLGSNLPELKFALLWCLSYDTATKKVPFNKESYIKIIKEIPLESKIKYINKCGDACLFNLLKTSSVELEDKIDILNEFFKDITIDNIKNIEDRLKSFKMEIPDNSYSRFNDVIKYLYVLYTINDTVFIRTDKIVFDNISITCMEENKRERDITITVLDEIKILPEVFERFRNLLKYNPNGYYEIRFYYKDYNKFKDIYFKLYTDDVIESFKDCPYNMIPISLKDYTREYPIMYKFYSDENFRKSITNEPLSEKLFSDDVLKEIGENKIRILYDCYIKNVGKLYNEYVISGLIKIIKLGIINDKKSILKTVEYEPELLKYFNLPYNIQKAICKNNPYMIKFISNPDNNLVKELSSKIPNINDYINNGE